MQFVLPYTKSRPQSGNLPITEEEMFENADSIENETENLSTVESETPPFDHISQADIDHENFSSTPSTSSMLSTSTTPSTSTTSSKKRKTLLKPPVDEMETAVINYLSKKNASKPENPDLQFFKSILSDVATLNVSQKLRFKLIILQMLQNMTKENETSARPPSRAGNKSDVQSNRHVSKNHSNNSFILDSSSEMECCFFDERKQLLKLYCESNG
ncbi:hypothetical protein ABEB36_015295 [Hypothenemus hampei]|uniref:BESS domain-containing protein n=1 Tax=Hypothenemus hampei TaxID=57062 RepID=A0ABD1E022_HYPHA